MSTKTKSVQTKTATKFPANTVIVEVHGKEFPLPNGDEIEDVVYSTTDYGKFKFLPENREPGHYEELATEMLKKDIQKYNPIRVTRNYEVIEGQNTLKARAMLGLPVFYQWDYAGATLDNTDIGRFNQHRKNWTYDEWLNYYCTLNYQNYLKMQKALDRTGLYLSTLIRLSKSSQKRNKFVTVTGEQKWGTHSDVFKDGRYVWSEDHDAMADRVAAMVEIVKEHWPAENRQPKTWVQVADALIGLFGKKGFKMEYFIHSLEIYGHMLSVRSKRDKYLDLFIHIYNFNKKKGKIK